MAVDSNNVWFLSNYKGRLCAAKSPPIARVDAADDPDKFACPAGGGQVERELQAVHAEFSRNTNSDARKVVQLRRDAGVRPYSMFSTGNLETLHHRPRGENRCICTYPFYPHPLTRWYGRHGYSSRGCCGLLGGGARGDRRRLPAP